MAEVEEMSATVSTSTQRAYGVARVCRVWKVPRSTVYRHRGAAREGRVRRRPGPQPELSDDALAARIRELQGKLEREYGIRGEGYRKAWARLRHAGVRVSKERVRRVMREHGLQAPVRFGPARGPRQHDGTIHTARPDEMWGTDATRVALAVGYVWIFVVVDHCTGECVGLHASLAGDRYQALTPVQEAVRRYFGRLEAGVAAGLKIRHDHGSQYMSRAFQEELAFLVASSSPSFVRAPEGNGVAERFIRTLKEQLLWVENFTSLEELQEALARFQEQYNEHWIVERHGYKTPAEVRRDLTPPSKVAA
jgi:transposase InsO family protein